MNLLIVDDDLRRVEIIADQLRDDGFSVEVIADLDEAFSRLSVRPCDISCVVLDIMMPPGSLLAEEDTENGLRSGVKFFEKLRLIVPSMPVLVLTNVDDQRLEERFSRELRCRCFRKEDLRPRDVTEQVQELISSGGTDLDGTT